MTTTMPPLTEQPDPLLITPALIRCMFTKAQKDRYSKILFGVRFKTQFANNTWLLTKEVAYWWQMAIYWFLNAIWIVVFTVFTGVALYFALVLAFSL